MLGKRIKISLFFLITASTHSFFIFILSHLVSLVGGRRVFISFMRHNADYARFAQPSRR
jgi:hypothetical protein